MNQPASRRMALLVAAAGLATMATIAQATENGGGSYPNGAENYMVGALPPPGKYYLLYASHYQANTLRDAKGDKIPIDFHVTANALVSRFLWVTDQQIAGGQLALYAFAPLVDLKVRVAGAQASDSGLGDMTFGVGLGYHLSPELHYAFALDINAPTGHYDRNALANIGRNYWNVEPLFAVTYVQRTGINADLKLMYDFNARNSDTDYRSGQEIHADYAVGWALGNGWTLGGGGYVYQQVTRDRQGGGSVPDSRGRAFALGPSVKYDSGKGWFVTAKYEREFAVRARPEGGGLKVKAVFPF